MPVLDKIFNEIYKKIQNKIKKNSNTSNRKKYLILNKKNIRFDEISRNNFINNDEYLKNRKIVTIGSGGYYGFYQLGVCMYIKEQYNTEKFLFSGASSGACASLFMTLKKDPKKMMDLIVNNKVYEKKNARQMLQEMKKNLLANFNENDFELDRLFVGANEIGQTNIYTDFENLEDAITCCEASSQIPFITGPLLFKYKNKYIFDGGFCENPYLNTNQAALHININIWGQNNDVPFVLYKTTPFDFEKLYEKGYQDTMKYGKETLDKIFEPLHV
uniref:PNPLA domain-containing protein n=1 Tax=viral metagenome TaxID=1070528 RepID=A0A6C0JYF3_9ZZZZ